jgi:hypothetical protein
VQQVGVHAEGGLTTLAARDRDACLLSI